VTTTQTIKAIAAAPGYATSALASATYTIRVAAPSFSPPADILATAVDRSQRHDRRGDDLLHHRREHADQLVGDVHGPNHRHATTTLKALAAKPPMADSTVATAIYALPASARDYAVGAGRPRSPWAT